MIYFKKIMLINFLISILFLVDRLTKWLALKIPEGGIFFISKKIIGLSLYKNQNIVFNLEIHQTLLYIFIFVILAILIWFLIRNYQNKNIFFIFSISLIIVGALSNLIDRLFFGYVIDFLSFFNYSIFNLSDVYIVVGVGFIFAWEFWSSRKAVKAI